MLNTLTYIYIVVLALAFISSLISFRLDFSYPLKMFSVLLGLTIVVECISVTMVKFHHSNVPLYNVFMLLEFWAYGYYYRRMIDSARVRKMINVFLWLYPVFWAIVVFFIFGINTWNSYVIVAGSFFTILFSAIFYYQLFTHAELVRLDISPGFWIATGLIIFYTFNLPYMGTLNFLAKNYLSLAIKLLYVLKILNIIMYSIFIYAFLCRINTKRSSSY
jgi:hypothetical protein